MLIHTTYRVLFLFILEFMYLFANASTDLEHLRHYELVEPLHINKHGRHRRDLSTFNDETNEHFEETSFTFSGHDRDFQLHLYKNNLLIPDTFVNIDQNEDGTYRYRNDIEHCYYHGYLGDRARSSAAASTCYGLNGVFQDEDGEEFVIEPLEDNKTIVKKNVKSSKHLLYKSRDVIVKENLTCGISHTRHDDNHAQDAQHVTSFNPFLVRSSEHRRSRRDTTPKYIELTVILDNTMFKKFGTVAKTDNRAFEIFNLVDWVYKTINTRVIIAHMIVWNVANKANVTRDATSTLHGIEKYSSDVLRGQMKLHFDSTLFITALNWRALAGLGGVGVMCGRSSAAVCRDHSTAPIGTANTISHEMGHNIGFLHNTRGCKCPKDPCVMAGNVPAAQVRSFSDCTQKKYEQRIKRGVLLCLMDYPLKIYGEIKCGNGFVEAGEECDCGTDADCKARNASACCNMKTCKLQRTAKCASGLCCENCQFKQKGAVCRPQNTECDLEEVCVGDTWKCPRNFYLQDGQPCLNNSAYCYHGTCKTHNSQCEMLWGPNGERGADFCFQINEDGDRYGNCGKDTNGRYKKCTKENQLCGKLQCQRRNFSIPLPRFPIIGHSRRFKTTTYWIGKKVFMCKRGSTTLSYDMAVADPTLAESGIKCGENSICLSQVCTHFKSLTYIKKCRKPCLNDGKCNNKGNCHCAKRFAPPYCQFPGVGGSVDSGAYGHVVVKPNITASLYISMSSTKQLSSLVTPSTTMYVTRIVSPSTVVDTVLSPSTTMYAIRSVSPSTEVDTVLSPSTIMHAIRSVSPSTVADTVLTPSTTTYTVKSVNSSNELGVMVTSSIYQHITPSVNLGTDSDIMVLPRTTKYMISIVNPSISKHSIDIVYSDASEGIMVTPTIQNMISSAWTGDMVTSTIIKQINVSVCGEGDECRDAIRGKNRKEMFFLVFLLIPLLGGVLFMLYRYQRSHSKDQPIEQPKAKQLLPLNNMRTSQDSASNSSSPDLINDVNIPLEKI